MTTRDEIKQEYTQLVMGCTSANLQHVRNRAASKAMTKLELLGYDHETSQTILRDADDEAMKARAANEETIATINFKT